MGLVDRLAQALPILADALRSGNLRVARSLLGPGFRGLIRQDGRRGPHTSMPVAHRAHFDWTYQSQGGELARLYRAGKEGQWDAADLDWKTPVDPLSDALPLLPMELLPVAKLPAFGRLSAHEQAVQRHHFTAWILSQFLHGEQGAFFASGQVAESVPWLDAKLCGALQIADEARHLEAFHGYLSGKLEKVYAIDDNLCVVVDAVMTDSRWDLKLLGMQVLIEGLALGGFGLLRGLTREPLLRTMLTSVIRDEARHLAFGVIAVRDCLRELSSRERRDREDWTFEMVRLLRNRFLLHEFYEEHWGHALSRRKWDELVLGSEMMALFRRKMFERMIPNLDRIGLLGERVRGRYEELGLFGFAQGRAVTELTAQELAA